MKKTLYVAVSALLGLCALSSCSSSSKMAEQAENVKIKCTPEVLEVVGGNVDAVVDVTYPKGYFNSKAILKVTPVIVYQGGEAKGKVFTYQGEKVKDNYKVVPSAGGTVTEKISIPYVEGMEKCYLELRGVASIKSKSFNLPSKKVADGLNTTALFVKAPGKVVYKADNYQDFIDQKAEGQIMYTVNSSEVRGSELKGKSIKDFQAALDEIEKDERKTLVSTEVVAYASPEGGESYNTKLSDKRASSAEKVWNDTVKDYEDVDHEVKSIGQDWEGFQELVSNSDLEDKDLILRVLSMYSDPAVRENEIKNMSELYKELKGEVLPELRRARFIANVEYQNYTARELKKLVEENSDVLDEEALLRAAKHTRDLSQKIAILEQAVDRFGSDRARYNIGVAYMEKGDLDKAAAAFDKVQTPDGDLQNAKGAVALRKGDLAAAEAAFKASDSKEAAYNLGVTDILKGDYAKAATELGEFNESYTCCHNTVLAYILNGDLDKAEKAATCKDHDVYYLRAIIAARRGDKAAAKEYLAKAKANDDELAKKAVTDIEFAELDK